MTPTSTASPEDDSLVQPKVLLVDDDEVNLLLTSIALRERGFSITEATSGERAIQVLADWLPDVVVLDALHLVHLDTSGLDSLRQLHKIVLLRDGTLHIENIQAQPREVIERSGFGAELAANRASAEVAV